MKDALRALPAYFGSGTHIEGLEAGDLFNLNSVLGSSIEVQVVDTLNRIRKVWDPDDEWPEYRFERSSQTFPDVRLVARPGGGVSVVLGIELKGWYLLAKESEPSFRYKVAPSACSEFDVMAVVPWHLKNVLSGVPVVYEPYIEQARFVADYRNFWWQHLRESRADRTIRPAPQAAGPYPPPKSKVNDEAVSDSGRNFGRVARIGVMDGYVDAMLAKRVSGVEARHWVLFFKTYAEAADPEAITARLTVELQKLAAVATEETASMVVELLGQLCDLL
ncbi:MAG TPA: hypothetical protein VG184_01895 [Acidimicrobiales bacterium]|nr:hypothetical protein [Acidimicrobiales bacterium]